MMEAFELGREKSGVASRNSKIAVVEHEAG